MDQDPAPRQSPSQRVDTRWRTRRLLQVPAILPPPIAFAEVLASRRSCRAMQRAPLREALSWLNYSTAPIARSEWGNVERARGPVLSSGALASVTPVLLSGRGAPRLFRPEPSKGAVAELSVGSRAPLEALRERAGDLLPETKGCDLIILICAFDRLNATYEASASLAWRDAGAMLQTLALTATALGLGFCPLGLLGSEAADALAVEGDLRPVGMAVVGV